jgi:hypothetical protein
MEWKALKSGATYRVQQSGNLSTWQDLVSPVPQAAGDVDARYGRWRITIPIGGESNFYRIEATFEPGALD